MTLTLSVRHIFPISTTVPLVAAIGSTARVFWRVTGGTNVGIITIAGAVSAHCSMAVARVSIAVLAVVSSRLVVADAATVILRCSIAVARFRVGILTTRTGSAIIADAGAVILRCSIIVARTMIAVLA